MLSEEPKRVTPYTESVLPSLPKDRSVSELPRWMKFNTDSVEPSLAIP
jgi:hypothetical protein